MRISAIALIMAATALLFGAPAAIAGSGTDVFAGHVCKGTFNTGTGRQNSQGAVHLRFFEDKKGELAVGFKMAFGPAAFQNPTADLPGNEESTSFTKLSGQGVRFYSQDQALWSLTKTGNKLSGNVDPRSNPARRNWLIAVVEMTCEAIASPAVK